MKDSKKELQAELAQMLAHLDALVAQNWATEQATWDLAAEMRAILARIEELQAKLARKKPP